MEKLFVPENHMKFELLSPFVPWKVSILTISYCSCKCWMNRWKNCSSQKPPEIKKKPVRPGKNRMCMNLFTSYPEVNEWKEKRNVCFNCSKRTNIKYENVMGFCPNCHVQTDPKIIHYGSRLSLLRNKLILADIKYDPNLRTTTEIRGKKFLLVEETKRWNSNLKLTLKPCSWKTFLLSAIRERSGQIDVLVEWNSRLFVPW